MTLGSIVEKETAKADERPVVSAVYSNRLRIGMPLQCDPTVIYALTKAGRYDGNIHKGDLQFESPYNTYRYPGLPPGPIASPGRASLEAAVHPIETGDLSDAEMLKHLIEAKNVTQVEVARATGIAESTISELLAGKRKLSRAHIGKLAKYFHVSPSLFNFAR